MLFADLPYMASILGDAAADRDALVRGDIDASPERRRIARRPGPRVGLGASGAVNLICLGSDRPLGDRLPRAPNVHVLPPVPYDELPSYLAAFDVCILPNRINAHTDGNDPLKLYDYLATGKPIVATRTAGTEDLTAFIRVADDAASFVRAVGEALAEPEGALRRQRQDLARAHSWGVRVGEVVDALAGLLGTADGASPARRP